MNNLIISRLEKVREQLNENGLDAYIIYTSDEHQSEYIDAYYKFRDFVSGFTGSAATMVITKDEAHLWTDGRYFLQAGIQLDGTTIVLEREGEKGTVSVSDYVKNQAMDKDLFRLGIDLRLISINSYNNLKKLKEYVNIEIVDSVIADDIWKERPLETTNELYILKDNVCGRPVHDKLKEIRAALFEKKADYIILSDLSEVCWTFNMRGSDILYSPVVLSYGVISQDEALLFVKNINYNEDNIKSFEKDNVRLLEYGQFDAFLKSLSGKSVVVDGYNTNAHILNIISVQNEVRFDSSYLYVKKHIKNEIEVEMSKKWHIEDGLAVTKFIYKIKQLVKTEKLNEYEAGELMDSLRYEIEGNLGLSFNTICAYGSNGAIVHYSADDENCKELKPEGFLLLDSGGQYEGATTDITRTIALGELSDDMKKSYTAVLKGVINLADTVFKYGIRGENLDILARKPIWEHLIDYRHGTGHGVGAQLNVHEGPQNFRYNINYDRPQPLLEAGMITSDEPGIYIEGEYGIRIENLVLIAKKAENEWGDFLTFDTLTYAPYEIDAIVPEMLNEREKEIINNYHDKIYHMYKERLTDKEVKWLREVTKKID